MPDGKPEDDRYLNGYWDPPLLNWEQREAGKPGQLPLPGFEDHPSQAERVFVRLARRWAAAIERAVPGEAVNQTVRVTELGALLLAHEHGKGFGPVAAGAIRKNIRLGDGRQFPLIDQMPWRLAYAGMSPSPTTSSAVHDLTNLLSHHYSCNRQWLMLYGWMVRSWLNPEEAVPHLLENVAGTILGAEMAWGLAGSFFSTEEQFIQATTQWTPQARFLKQYAERCKELEISGLSSAQCDFLRKEIAARREIEAEAFCDR